MNRIVCSECRFWVHPVWDTEGALGPITMDCRRHAPAVCRADDDGVGHNATWPRTKDTDWCADGEAEPAEMKAERERHRKEVENSPFGVYLRPRRRKAKG